MATPVFVNCWPLSRISETDALKSRWGRIAARAVIRSCPEESAWYWVLRRSKLRSIASWMACSSVSAGCCCAGAGPPWAAAAKAMHEAARAARITSVSSRGDLREQTQAQPGDESPGQGAALWHVARRDQPETDQQRRPEGEDIEYGEQLHHRRRGRVRGELGPELRQGAGPRGGAVRR